MKTQTRTTTPRPIIFVIAFLGLIVSSAALAPSSALAKGDGQMTLAIAKQELRQITVSLRGEVSCAGGTAAKCDLKLKDVHSGQTYFLSNASEVLRLYNAGTSQVVIEGILQSSDSIDVQSVRTL